VLVRWRRRSSQVHPCGCTHKTLRPRWLPCGSEHSHGATKGLSRMPHSDSGFALAAASHSCDAIR
jgi:hypothetical protein